MANPEHLAMLKRGVEAWNAWRTENPTVRPDLNQADLVGETLAGAAVDFFSCFISYSSEDQDFADRLHADLQYQGVRCWFAPPDVRAGKKLDEQIGEAIRIYDKLLLILSTNSMNSEWVKTEIA